MLLSAPYGGGVAAPRFAYESNVKETSSWDVNSMASLISVGSLPTTTTTAGAGAASQSSSSTSGGMWITRTTSLEDIVLVAEPWVFSDLSFTPLVPIGRGVINASGRSWRLARTPDASEIAAVRALAPATAAVLSAAGCDATGESAAAAFAGVGCSPSPTGIIFTITNATWTLTGMPSNALFKSSGLAAGTASLGAPHIVVLNGKLASRSLRNVVPRGSLRPGFSYTITLTVTTSASWSYILGASGWEKDAATAATVSGTPLSADALIALSALVSNSAPSINPITVEGNLPTFSPRDFVRIAPPGSVAFSPTLYVRAPPSSGGVSIVPSTGIVGTSTFLMSTNDWVLPDTSVYNDTMTPKAENWAVANLLAAIPLPATLVATLGSAWLDGSLPSSSLESLSYISACSDDSNIGTPYDAILTLLGAPLALSAPMICAGIITSSAALRADSTSYSYAEPNPLLISFLVLNGSPVTVGATLGTGITPGARGSLSWAATLAAAPVLSSSLSLPGVPIAHSSYTNVLSTKLSFPSAGGAATLLVLVADGAGGTGAAMVGFTLTPFALSTASDPSTLVTYATDLLTVSSGAASVTANPFATLGAASAAAAALASAALSNGNTNSVAAGNARAAVASLISSSLISVNASSLISDATIACALASLASATAGANGSALLGSSALPPSASGATWNALTTTLSLAKGSTLPGAPRPPPLSPSVGTAALSTIANLLAANASAPGAAAAAALVQGGVNTGSARAPASADKTIAEAAAAALSLFSDAALRSAAPGDPPVAFSSAPSSMTFDSNYCGSAIVFSAWRVGGASGASSLALANPMPPCINSSSLVPRPMSVPMHIIKSVPAPSITLSSSVLASLGTTVDVFVTQWGVSPHSESAGANALPYTPRIVANTLSAAVVAANSQSPNAAAAADTTIPNLNKTLLTNRILLT